MTYAEKLQDPRWQRVRLQVMERDLFACRDCNSSEKQLHIHHCFYEKGNPWDTNPKFLLTLCDGCHKHRQSLENDGRRMLGQIFARLDPGNLEDFVGSMARHAANESATPTMEDIHELDWNTEGRWFTYAWNHPRFGAAYNKVTGSKVDWKAIKAKKEAECHNDF